MLRGSTLDKWSVRWLSHDLIQFLIGYFNAQVHVYYVLYGYVIVSPSAGADQWCPHGLHDITEQHSFSVIPVLRVCQHLCVPSQRDWIGEWLTCLAVTSVTDQWCICMYMYTHTHTHTQFNVMAYNPIGRTVYHLIVLPVQANSDYQVLDETGNPVTAQVWRTCTCVLTYIMHLCTCTWKVLLCAWYTTCVYTWCTYTACVHALKYTVVYSIATYAWIYICCYPHAVPIDVCTFMLNHSTVLH